MSSSSFFPIRARLGTLVLISSTLLAAALVLPAQAMRGVTNEKHGFKVKIPRFTAEVPNQPDEEQILAKYKGSKQIKVERQVDPRTGKTIREAEAWMEIWVVRIENPIAAAGAEQQVGPITPGGGAGRGAGVEGGEGRADGEPGEGTEAGAGEPPPSLKELQRRAKNSGRSLKEFLDRRIRGGAKELAEAPPTRGLTSRGDNDYTIHKHPRGFLESYTFAHEHASWGHELFGLVVLGSHLSEFEWEVQTMVRSLERLDAPTSRYAVTDPYADSELADIPRRREVRSRLVEGWRAEDTENFILITDMPPTPSNLRLVRDMMVDLETMRDAYLERFPPVAPLHVVSTVRVCNSYDGYLRYSSKPGTGGYWHPIAEELVLFNPVGKVAKDEWMRRVTPKAILYHEAMHQYFHYANGEMPPAPWFNEGYGEYFGGARTDRYQKKIASVGKNELRWEVVKETRKEKSWPELKKLLALTQPQFYSRKSKDYPVLKNYAMGWAFCYFLEQERARRPGERNETWAAIPDRYVENLRVAAAEVKAKLPADAPKGSLIRAAIPIQKAAYEKTFGDTDWAALQADWIEAMKAW